MRYFSGRTWWPDTKIYKIGIGKVVPCSRYDGITQNYFRFLTRQLEIREPGPRQMAEGTNGEKSEEKISSQIPRSGLEGCC